MRCSSSSRMKNLEDAIIAELSASTNPSMAIDPELVHLRLQQLFPTFQTPSHPPYSSMIRQAILKLNEECGSTEEAISRHLEKEYMGLPLAHASFLSHHLKKLSSDGELVCVGNERYMINVDGEIIENVEKGDQALVQGKGSEVEAVDGCSSVNGDRVPESENQCEVERQSAEANALNTACEHRMEAGRESVKEVQEEGLNFSGQIKSGHQLKILYGNGEIVSGSNEQYMVQVDGGDFGNEGMNHGLNVSTSDEKEDQTLVQLNGRKVQAIVGWSGVNVDQAVESENGCEFERTEGPKEQKKVMKEPLTEVQEESQNFSGQIEVSHHLEKHKEIDCANNEQYMVQVDGDDLDKEDEEMSHRLSISDRDEKEDRTLVQVKRKEVEANDGSNGVNGDQAAESENRCEVERLNVEVSSQNKTFEQRMEGFEEQNEVAEEVDAAKGKLTKVAQKRRGKKRKRQNTKRQIKKKGFHHQLSISDRVEKEDLTLVQVAESENPLEIGGHSVEVSGQNKACKQRTEELEEKNEGRRESLKEVQEERLNFSGPIEVSEEVDVAEEKLTKVTRNRRGLKRKRQAKTKRQRKVLKNDDDILQPTMEVEKNYVEQQQQQMEGGSGVKKSAGKQEQPQLCKMISEQVHPQGLKIDIRTNMRGLPFDRDVKNLKTSLPKRSGRLLEKQKKEPLKHEEDQKRKLRDKKWGSFIVCALPAPRSRTNIDLNAPKHLTESRSASLESRESGEILLRQLERSTPTKPRSIRGNTSKRFTQISKDLELEKQEKQFREPEKPQKYEVKTKQGNFGGDKATVSPSIKVKVSMDQGHRMGLSIVCALAAPQSRTNINSKARMPLTDSVSASSESRESGEILLRSLKRSTPRKPRALRRNTPKRFIQSEPKLDGMSKGLELEKQEQQLEYELMTKQANFGCEDVAVSPSIKVKDPMDQGHQTERIKVYVRRSKSQLKEPGHLNICKETTMKVPYL
ncbi:uncharacterized protein LOC120150312 isoform X2 [Hibiscus syriacus]|uniref:uncharacterized protein LOC120150312 isoform X2 n=1 Tax=Hibiscus syriacus TaxID=106335 RepID=UPI001923FAA1|nr:uncharacterized protein LOC120150312 isoform X2 [Hibiscus syriacus]